MSAIVNAGFIGSNRLWGVHYRVGEHHDRRPGARDREQ